MDLQGRAWLLQQLLDHPRCVMGKDTFPRGLGERGGDSCQKWDRDSGRSLEAVSGMGQKGKYGKEP